MSGTYPITGIQAGLNPATPNQPKPLRRDVDTWFTDPLNSKQISLFLQAMAQFQAIDVKEKISFFQVAGIHGLPLVPWDEETTSQSPNTLWGYCTHATILFPTWHRPYMALIEQCVYNIMVTLVQSYPEAVQSDWLAAANAWRFPYWDWAAKKFGVEHPLQPNYNIPLIVRDATVTIEIGTSTGTTWKSIPNPMYVFQTPGDVPMGSLGPNAINAFTDSSTGETYPYQLCKATNKYPLAYDATNPEAVAQWVDGVQNNDGVVAALRGHVWYETVGTPPKPYTDSLGEAVFRLFSQNYFSTYDAFASTRFADQKLPNPPPPPDYLSLEDIHNNIHLWTGGETGGHMYEIAVAAFDPIFFLHHCNVDRQFAIWQALNPTAWFDDPSQQLSYPDGNWSIAPNAITTPETPLAPFHSDTKGTYYTSVTSQDWTQFGYSYPELQPWKYLVNGQVDQATYTQAINRKVVALYSSTRDIVLSSPHPLVEHGEDSAGNKHVKHDDYVVNVRYERFALGGTSFTVYILIGKDRTVGSVHNFSTPPEFAGNSADGCANCRAQIESGALQKGQVHITNALLDDIKDNSADLSSLKPEDVEKYLKDNLSWIVTKGHNKIPLESIPSLKVSVAGGKGLHHRDVSKGSRYSDYKVIHAITEGRTGGLERTDPY